MLHPAGANGVALKSKLPLMMEYADSLGCIWDRLRKLRVIIAWGMRRSHPVAGKHGSVPDKMEIK